MLNYTNPMSMICLAAGRTSQMSIVGLCHSVQGTSHLLAQYAGVPYEEMTWDCAGVNHLAWFTKLEHNGQSLYPKLHAKFAKEIAAGIQEAAAGKTSHDARNTNDGTTWQQGDLVRKNMCLHFGAFITESSGHLSEYLPYYRKSDAGRQLLRVRYEGGSRFYATNWPNWRQAADHNRLAMLRGTTPMNWKRSWEYASWIIEAHQKAQPFRIYGNVMNNDGSVAGSALISNLPADGCVEVACLVDGTGVHPVRYGELPAQMAAIHALLLDPYTAAVCTPAQIKQMTLELFKAEKQFLPGYK